MYLRKNFVLSNMLSVYIFPPSRRKKSVGEGNNPKTRMGRMVGERMLGGTGDGNEKGAGRDERVAPPAESYIYEPAARPGKGLSTGAAGATALQTGPRRRAVNWM